VVRGSQAPKRISAEPKGRGSEHGGVYRAELHTRALQWERTTAYVLPSKARGVIIHRKTPPRYMVVTAGRPRVITSREMIAGKMRVQ
jgi:hypothetical protein